MRIIGLDFGHCEIAAAMAIFLDGVFASMKNLFLDGGKNTVIPAEVEYEGEIFNYFKASPKHFNEKVDGNNVKVLRRELMSLLFKKIMNGIMEYNTEINSGDQIMLIVGCPTSGEWTSEKNRKEYETLIKEATGVAEVRVIPESRAAMFSVSQGLVWVGLVDEMQEECIAAAALSVVSSDVAKISKLKDGLKSSMGEKIYQSVLSSVDEWSQAATDESLNDLQERMDRNISKIEGGIKRDNKLCVENWTSGIIHEIRIQLEAELRKKLGTTLAQKMTMSQSMWDSLNQSLDDISIDKDKIVDGIDVNSIITNIIMMVLMLVHLVICRVFGSFLSPSPIIVGGPFVGVLNNGDRFKPRTVGTRKKAKNSIEKKEQKEKIIGLVNAESDNAVDSQVTYASIENDIEAITRSAYEIMTLKFEI